MTPRAAFRLLCLMNVVWGGSYAVSKWALTQVPPATLAAMRFLVGGLALLPFCPPSPHPLSGRDWLELALVGLIGITLAFLAHFHGIRLSTATKAAIFVALEPAFLMLLSVLFLGEKLSGRLLLALFFSTVGTLVLVVDGKNVQQLWHEFFEKGEVFGDVLLILSSLLGGLYTIFNKPLSDRMHPIRGTSLECLFGAVFLVPWIISEAPLLSASSFSPSIFATVGFLGLICTAVGYTLWNQALTVITPSQMGITLNIQPLAGVAFGFFVMGESVTPMILGGAGLILLGISLTPRSGHSGSQ